MDRPCGEASSASTTCCTSFRVGNAQSFSSVYPWQESFARILAGLGAAARASPR